LPWSREESNSSTSPIPILNAFFNAGIARQQPLKFPSRTETTPNPDLKSPLSRCWAVLNLEFTVSVLKAVLPRQNCGGTAQFALGAEAERAIFGRSFRNVS